VFSGQPCCRAYIVKMAKIHSYPIDLWSYVGAADGRSSPDIAPGLKDRLSYGGAIHAIEIRPPEKRPTKAIPWGSAGTGLGFGAAPYDIRMRVRSLLTLSSYLPRRHD
jgi:hypothetical protein